MRKIVLDFDLTVLLPLSLFALITLWHSIRAYREFPPHRKEKWNARRVICISCGVLVATCGLLFVSDDWKVIAAYSSWDLLSLVSAVSFAISVGAAWHYAKRADWFRLGACVLAGLLIVASTEHFYHQKINARHITCPECTDDDGQSDEK